MSASAANRLAHVSFSRTSPAAPSMFGERRPGSAATGSRNNARTDWRSASSCAGSSISDKESSAFAAGAGEADEAV